jgi:hypothetical protein
MSMACLLPGPKSQSQNLVGLKNLITQQTTFLALAHQDAEMLEQQGREASIRS